MLYHFRLLLQGQEDFMREIVIFDNNTFLDFYQIIQKSVKFSSEHLASFFICNNDWEKEQEITLIDMSGKQEFLMENTILKDIIKDKNQKLLYVFDFFSDRAFFIELTKISEKKKELTNYPICLHSNGEAPEQIKIDNSFEIDEIYNFDNEEDNFDNEHFESLDDYEDLY